MQKLGSQNHAQQLLSVLAGEAIDWDNMEIMNESPDGNDKSLLRPVWKEPDLQANVTLSSISYLKLESRKAFEDIKHISVFCCYITCVYFSIETQGEIEAFHGTKEYS